MPTLRRQAGIVLTHVKGQPMPATIIRDALLDPVPRVHEAQSELLVELELDLVAGGALQVDPAAVTACVRDGVLTLRVPKAHTTRAAIEGFHPEVPPI